MQHDVDGGLDENEISFPSHTCRLDLIDSFSLNLRPAHHVCSRTFLKTAFFFSFILLFPPKGPCNPIK